ncbi:MAG: META domain-containing protein [Nocardioidaceae bacterium]
MSPAALVLAVLLVLCCATGCSGEDRDAEVAAAKCASPVAERLTGRNALLGTRSVMVAHLGAGRSRVTGTVLAPRGVPHSFLCEVAPDASDTLRHLRITRLVVAGTRHRPHATAPVPTGIEGEWALGTLRGATYAGARVGNHLATLTFDRRGRWSSTDGCNDIEGRYTYDGAGGFTAREEVSTDVGCSARPLRANIAAIIRARRVTGHDDELELRDGDGHLLGTYTRR